ncbi:DUF4126 domain-containing protein [Leptolyngbya sp. FACHB-711]|uniref:DUF4126 domain-containing protein n=1 Tax=unclassified Leptolyngbya TaxID=2650499 RepID=UPI001686BC71|nr:DUF4126 domain-containing protein [Leptolyngbya sp. FACHB-711]MBD1848944.1 DUF4126 domain-containing protein [Cyanobacteria bacterium FACHB-502]MBD2023499.1 DUF4126 domain-containing protein [Leptolyngbya sp. FACHB-711]
MIEVFAALALSTAAGMRIALPLLLIGLLYSDNLWANMPLLSQIPPRIVLGVLVSWSTVELFLSKGRLGQRVLQIVQLVGSPIVGAIVGIAVARTALFPGWFTVLIGTVCGLIALVLQLVQIGWFYRLRGLPIWMIFAQDFLCVLLVLLAFDAPTQGGIIALLLFWLMIRSSVGWRKWYQAQAKPGERKNPRRYKQEPD